MKLLTKVLQRFLWEDVVKILMKFCQRCLHQLDHVLMRRSCEDPADSLEESLRGLAQVLMRRSCWDPGEVPIRGPSMILHRPLSEGLVEMVRSFPRGPWNKILQMPYLRGACMEALLGCSWEVLVSRSCKTLSSSSRSFDDDLVGFSSGSWHEDLGPGLLQFLVRRSWGGLMKFSRCPCMISHRSLWEDRMEILLKSFSCQEVLALRSWCSSLVLVGELFFWHAQTKFLYEDLLTSSVRPFLDDLVKFYLMSWYEVLVGGPAA